MKRTVIGILTVIVVLGAGTAGVLAAGTGARQNGFVNGTGICIYSEDGCNYEDNIRDGICDNIEEYTGQNNGNRMNYADENGDGICDNRNTDCIGIRRNGQGRGCRR